MCMCTSIGFVVQGKKYVQLGFFRVFSMKKNKMSKEQLCNKSLGGNSEKDPKGQETCKQHFWNSVGSSTNR